MDITQLIAAARAALDGLIARAATLDAEADGILATARDASAGVLTPEQSARIMTIVDERTTARTDITAGEARLASLEKERDADAERLERSQQQQHHAPAPAGGAARTNPVSSTYSRHSAAEGVSFFRDMYTSQRGLASGAVAERLNAHSNEIRELVSLGKVSERAIATGGLGGMVPPQYLTEEYAPIMRAGRPVANLVRPLPLPATGMSLTVPRGTTGVTTAPQINQNTAASQQDIAITDLTVPVVTIAGQADVSRQSIERGVGIDEIIWADLAGAYAVSLDQEVISGPGTTGRALGILNTGGITQMAAFGAAVTVATLYSKVAGGINAVQTGRLLPPTAIAMHPRRWAWLTAQLDSSGRPVVLPTANGPVNVVAASEGEITAVTVATKSGELQSLPVVPDASLPTAAGTGPEDQVIISRFEDLLLWEDNGGAPTNLMFEQTLGGQLTLKLVAYGYMAFTAGRYPAATAVIGGNAGAAGNGLVAPSF